MRFVDEKHLVVSDYKGYVTMYDIKTGKIKAQTKVCEKALTSLELDDYRQLIYVSGHSSSVFALDY